jgi:hypothetical protein
MVNPIMLRGMMGLGDNIYQRSIVRELAKVRPVYLITAWPQLYADVPDIWPLRVASRLRTQTKNMKRDDLTWSAWPRSRIPEIRINYVSRPKVSILEALGASVGLQPDALTFDLPSFGLPYPLGKPYIVIRPATIRTEWLATGRNPDPEYLALAADKLRDFFQIISIADLAPGEEWALEPLPYADQTFHAGELTIEETLSLVQGAAGVVGGVGWLVPAAIAYRTPMLLIFGGWGFYNGPERIFDSRIDASNVRSLLPPQFCRCRDQSHPCDKRIPNIEADIDRWALDLVASRQAAMASGGRDRMVSGIGKSL